MVIASSTWVRPAQALIFSESGEVEYFPPRNRGSLPRALTFGDEQDCNWRQHESNQRRLSSCEEPQLMSPFQFSEQRPEENSFFITSESENFHMEDPPEEYTSFESEYSRHSIARASEIHSPCFSSKNLERLEVPVMSTPNEQYVNNVLKRKGLSKKSVLSPKQQPFLSSASDTQDGCISPLLQTEPGPPLPLDQLVDLYSKKYEAARVARLSKAGEQDPESRSNETNGEYVDGSPIARINGADGLCGDRNGDRSEDYDQDSGCKSQNRMALEVCNSLQLVTFDIHQFLQKLEENLVTSQLKNKQYEDWLCISIEQLELMVMKCCKETVELVMME